MCPVTSKAPPASDRTDVIQGQLRLPLCLFDSASLPRDLTIHLPGASLLCGCLLTTNDGRSKPARTQRRGGRGRKGKTNGEWGEGRKKKNEAGVKIDCVCVCGCVCVCVCVFVGGWKERGWRSMRIQNRIKSIDEGRKGLLLCSHRTL